MANVHNGLAEAAVLRVVPSGIIVLGTQAIPARMWCGRAARFASRCLQRPCSGNRCCVSANGGRLTSRTLLVVRARSLVFEPPVVAQASVAARFSVPFPDA